MSRMSYAKPESALVKAQELVQLGKPQQALETLRLVLTNKRRTWNISLEQVQIMYIKLAVKTKRIIKDTLNQYKSMCQTGGNWVSLEKVLAAYIGEVNERTQEAQAKVNAALGTSGLSEIAEELEDTPDTLMARALGSGVDEDRSGKLDLVQWVKYLWEAYKSVFEVVRNQDKMQEFFHKTAQACMVFCTGYKRTQDFKKLCDLLKNQNIEKFNNHQNNAVNLSAPETQELFLRTRYFQLKCASELELWQKAYETIKEMDESRLKSRAPLRSKQLVPYFDQLTQIFWASKNFLFHAFTLNKLYELTAADLSPEEKQELASRVTLATLVTPHVNAALDQENDSDVYLKNLLGFRRALTRSSLMKGLYGSEVFAAAHPKYQQVAALLESSFSPLTMKSKLAPLLEDLKASPALSQYALPLQQTATLRLLIQLSKVFKTIKTARFLSLSPPGAMMHEVETLVIDANNKGLTRIRFDHRKQLIHFADEDMTGKLMSQQLSSLSVALEAIADRVAPANPENKQGTRKFIINLVAQGAERDHEDIPDRMEAIERLREKIEEDKQKEEKEDETKKAAAAAKRAREEKARLEKEAKDREVERQRRQRESLEMKKLQALAKKLESDINSQDMLRSKKTGREITKAIKDVEMGEVDAAELVKLQNKLVQEAKTRAEEKKAQELTELDYLTRALRVRERPLIEAANERQIREDKEQAEVEYRRFVEQEQKAHEKALAEKKRFLRMRAGAAAYAEAARARRQEAYAKELAAYNERKAAWQKDQDKKAEERRVQEEAEREERERQRKVEEEREAERARAREEKEEADRVRREELAAERAAAKLKDDEIQKKRREVEERIEQRDRDAREKVRVGNNSARPSGDRFGGRDDRFGGRDDRFGGRGDRFGGRDDRFGGRDDRFGGRDDRFGGRDAGPRDEPSDWRSAKKDTGSSSGAYRPKFGGRDDGARPAAYRPPTRGDDRDDGPRSSGAGAYRPPVRGGDDRGDSFRSRDDGPRASGGAYRPGGFGRDSRDERGPRSDEPEKDWRNARSNQPPRSNNDDRGRPAPAARDNTASKGKYVPPGRSNNRSAPSDDGWSSSRSRF